MKKLTFFTLFILSGLSISWGQDDKTPKYSNEFLNIGVGARALAMSNSIIASSNDVTSGYWNPVGLTEIESDLQFGLMHAEYFAGIAKYDYGAIAKRIDDKSAMSFSVIRFGVDNIPNTTELIDNQGNVDYNRITFFSAADLGLVFSYGRKINEHLSLGGSAKVINRKVGSFAKSWGFGIDFSAVYKINDWTFAAMGRDVTTTFNAWSYTLSDRTIEVFTQTGNEIPQNGLEITMPRIILGAARSWALSEKFGLLAEIDADVTTDGKRNTLIVGNPFSLDPHLGIEVDFKKLIYLRTGVGNFQRITQLNGKEVMTVQPNIGIGIKFKGIAIDYALTDIGDASVALYSNIFSLRFDLNPKKEQKGSYE
ncbi:MAG: PorV/PorQ family protein [Flavobacteriales bacterium]|nr:PorV/PorQ family protein [Flavobacteriales bacterium]